MNAPIDDDWDGEWWLDVDPDPRIDELVRQMSGATPDEARRIAREIFQRGHKHGFEHAEELDRY